MDIFWWYMLGINSATFIIRGVDKWKAVTGRWRIRERDLLIMSALGGWLGAYIAMTWWRHKTLKGAFLWKFWLIVACWIIFFLWVLTRSF